MSGYIKIAKLVATAAFILMHVMIIGEYVFKTDNGGCSGVGMLLFIIDIIAVLYFMGMSGRVLYEVKTGVYNLERELELAFIDKRERKEAQDLDRQRSRALTAFANKGSGPRPEQTVQTATTDSTPIIIIDESNKEAEAAEASIVRAPDTANNTAMVVK